MRFAMTVIFLLLSCPIAGDVPEAQKAEVEHLIAYLQDSGCEMVRNGKPYDGGDGVNHVQRKYRYFADQITSTEEFIEYSATKSTRSGQYYQVKCPGKEPERSQDWLLRELKAFRDV